MRDQHQLELLLAVKDRLATWNQENLSIPYRSSYLSLAYTAEVDARSRGSMRFSSEKLNLLSASWHSAKLGRRSSTAKMAERCLLVLLHCDSAASSLLLGLIGLLLLIGDIMVCQDTDFLKMKLWGRM